MPRRQLPGDVHVVERIGVGGVREPRDEREPPRQGQQVQGDRDSHGRCSLAPGPGRPEGYELAIAGRADAEIDCGVDRRRPLESAALSTARRRRLLRPLREARIGSPVPTECPLATRLPRMSRTGRLTPRAAAHDQSRRGPARVDRRATVAVAARRASPFGPPWSRWPGCQPSSGRTPSTRRSRPSGEWTRNATWTLPQPSWTAHSARLTCTSTRPGLCAHGPGPAPAARCGHRRMVRGEARDPARRRGDRDARARPPRSCAGRHRPGDGSCGPLWEPRRLVPADVRSLALAVLPRASRGTLFGAGIAVAAISIAKLHPASSWSGSVRGTSSAVDPRRACWRRPTVAGAVILLGSLAVGGVGTVARTTRRRSASAPAPSSLDPRNLAPVSRSGRR